MAITDGRTWVVANAMGTRYVVRDYDTEMNQANAARFFTLADASHVARMCGGGWSPLEVPSVIAMTVRATKDALRRC